MFPYILGNILIPKSCLVSIPSLGIATSHCQPRPALGSMLSDLRSDALGGTLGAPRERPREAAGLPWVTHHSLP